MVFKHLLLGLGGSAAIGGIGYGIYSSSQFYEKENMTGDGNTTSPNNQEGSDSKSPLGDQGEGGGSVKTEEETEEEQGQGGGSTRPGETPEQTISKNSDKQVELPEAARTTGQ